MASPPPSATSPTASSPLVLPRQRPALALPGHSRRVSITSTTSSQHPLRQTSFPPADSLEARHQLASDGQSGALAYSPSQGSLDDFSDSEIVSAISGPAGEEALAGASAGGAGAGKKRKRGEKRPRGRPRQNAARAGSVSLVNGEEGRKSRGATSVVNGNNGGEGGADEDDDDGEDDGEVNASGGRVPLWEGGQMTTAELNAENQQRAMFREHLARMDALPLKERKGLTVGDHGERFDVLKRTKLRTADVRRLVNQTLSQSVPANVVTVVSSYAKLFAGMIIESAREVQAEWEVVEEKRADGGDNPVYKKLKSSHFIRDTGAQELDNDRPLSKQEAQEKVERPASKHSDASSGGNIKMEDSEEDHSSSARCNTLNGASAESTPVSDRTRTSETLYSSLEECDRGPLLPDHLREALRRYKKSRKGGAVGFTGMSLEGKEVAAARVGGRRLFR